MRAGEGAISQNRERIAALETSIEHERLRTAELDEQVARYRRQSTTMSVRAGDLEQQLRETAEALAAAEREHREVARKLAEHERGLTKLTSQVDEEHLANEQRRASHLEQLRSRSSLDSRISVLDAKVAAARATGERSGKRLSELTAAHDLLATEAEQSRAQGCRTRRAGRREAQRAGIVAIALRAQRAAGRAAARTTRPVAAAALGRCRASQLARRIGKAAGRRQRRRQTSLGPGARPRREPAGKDSWPGGRSAASELRNRALGRSGIGELAQCVVVAGGRELTEHLQGPSTLAGRVGFIRLEAMPPKTHLDQIDLHGRPGVLGRADEFVETDPGVCRAGAPAAGQDVGCRNARRRVGSIRIGWPWVELRDAGRRASGRRRHAVRRTPAYGDRFDLASERAARTAAADHRHGRPG